MSSFDSIVVGNDLVSEHWLAEQFPATVKTLRASWKDREDHGKQTPRSGLAALAGTFGSRLSRLRERDNAEDLSALHTAVRVALQCGGDETVWIGQRGGTDLTIAAVVSGSPTETPLLILQAQDAKTVEDLLDTEGAGRLVTPAQLGNESIASTAKAISEAFQCEEPPALVLVTAGGWLLLAERGSWPEGRWLAVDLATVCDRKDPRAAGELETAAALIGSDTLLPGDDGTTLFLTLLEESVKHAVGVSQDLRDGIRESIELLATDVLRRRRSAELPDDVPDLAKDLTRQCLRYLYRILFLLYAEARPELGVLPVGAPEYSEGYGLDRLRELVLTELTTEASRNGTHVYDSLATLFRLVNDGYPPQTFAEDGTGLEADDRGELRFEALRADLFSRDAVALIDEVGLGNHHLLQVLSRLLLSKKQRGRDRGFVSYAQLGINQLGAVYEGLMSYTGSIATDHCVEVAKDGDRSKGSWIVRTSAIEGFDPAWFVMVTNADTGLSERVTYAPGDFVFRLSGYERQRSASYYTPESLTQLVVNHSLAELLDQDGVTTPATALLELTICEPALGSGAFLVEAVRQLAGQYLDRRQKELGERIPAEDYPAELQKVKAHIALHQCYGVDLNATAVELAEITLWLDAMHPGLRSPWFGLHLRRGNSLIGARRETWQTKQLAGRAWLTTVPTAKPLSQLLTNDEVHHFLLPAAGWGAVADTKEAKELVPEARSAVAAWRKKVTATLAPAEVKRLTNLARRVEVLWELALRRLEIAEREARRHIGIWGAESLPSGSGAVQREQIEAVLRDPDGAYQRLHRVMDAWAALWSWPVTTDIQPPTRTQWLDALTALLGNVSKAETVGGRGLFAREMGWDDLDEAEHQERAFGQMRPVEQVLVEHPWLRVCETISAGEGFFHWELAFSPVFAQGGGFDLQLGNPPWVRPIWDDALILAETDPWFGLADKPRVGAVASRRQRLIDLEGVAHDTYLDARADIAGFSEHLGSAVERPLLAGTQPDLYRCFMDRTWRSMATSGVVGLIHPESHFTELRAGGLRRQTYQRLRRHWNFRNELRLFEIHHAKDFGVHIYGEKSGVVGFQNASSIFSPDTITRSINHLGFGPEPGIKDDEGQWDLRPHKNRIINVDAETLAAWATILDLPGTAPQEARMLYPINVASQNVLTKIGATARFETVNFEWSAGWHESADKKLGFFVEASSIPEEVRDVILQGPHISVASPYARQPNPSARSRLDTTAWDLESLPRDAIPRTNFQRAKPWAEYSAGYPRWRGRLASDFYRLAWREMVDSSNARTLHAAILAPGPMHVGGLLSLGNLPHRDLAVAAGMWASLPVDYLVKASGKGHMKVDFISRFPHPESHPLIPELLLRALRLNCCTSNYASLWEDLFDTTWSTDSWTQPVLSTNLGYPDWRWSIQVPLRIAEARRLALVEIDALAAVMLGISSAELSAIYTTQFGTLRRAERKLQFDANGRQVPAPIVKEIERIGDRADCGRYERPFKRVDRVAEMTIAHVEFSRRLTERTAAKS